jgi:hypothetical protein
VCFCDINDNLFIKARFLDSSHVQGNIRASSEIGEGCHCDTLLTAESQELILGEIWVHLNLKYCWFDRRVVDDITDQSCSDIAHTDISNETFLDQLFHCSPGFLVRDIVFLHAWLVSSVVPARWVAGLERDEFQSDREMDQVKVKIGETKIFQSLQASCSHMFLAMVVVPKLRCDKDIFTFDNTVSDSLSYPLANFLLIAIVTSGIEASVAGLKCILNHLTADVVGDLPQA